MQFYEWLIFQEAITRAVLRVFSEVHSFDPALDAVKDQTNYKLSSVLGHQIDYFGICLMHARKYPDIGNDDISLATHIANTIMGELNNPNGELSQRFAEAGEDEAAVTRLFHTAVSLRTRREGAEFTGYRRGAATSVPISSLGGGAAGDEEANQDDIFGSYEDEGNYAAKLEKLKNALIQELQDTLDAATHQRTRERLVKAILVARERFKDADSGDRVPMGQLLKLFSKDGPLPAISKGAMVNILREIENAFARMAEKLDNDTLRRGAEQGGSWKASRKKRTG
jgi:hypothetical protein